MTRPVHITAQNFEREVVQSGPPVLVDVKRIVGYVPKAKLKKQIDAILDPLPLPGAAAAKPA